MKSKKVIFLDIDGVLETKGGDVSHYLKLDDMDNFLLEQQDHFVWIDPNVGITDGNVIQGIMILNNLQYVKEDTSHT